MSGNRLIGKRDRDRDAIFRPKVPGDVTFPRCVFDQIDVAWTDGNLLASRNLNFSSAAERNHELASRSGMPLVGIVRVSLASRTSWTFRRGKTLRTLCTLFWRV